MQQKPEIARDGENRRKKISKVIIVVSWKIGENENIKDFESRSR